MIGRAASNKEDEKMEELDRALDIAMKGPEADRALAAFRRVIKAWDVALPPVKPLVLDFGLGNFANVGLIEYWIANEMQAGYCGKYLFVFDGQTCPLHCHRVKHETFFIVKGRVAMEYDGGRQEMGEGEVLPVLPGKAHSFTGIGPALLLELSMPCQVDDNYFDDPEIPIGGNWRGRRSP
jgi:mannose-6-phosphate isomerase-like protein (cupin superfamily)